MLPIYQAPTNTPGTVVLRATPQTWAALAARLDSRSPVDRAVLETINRRSPWNLVAEAVSCSVLEANTVMDAARRTV